MTTTASAENLDHRFEEIAQAVQREVSGLTHAQLDWSSEKWEWSKWNIRKQMSHMPTVGYRWMTLPNRWNIHLPHTASVLYFEEFCAKPQVEQGKLVAQMDAKQLIQHFNKGNSINREMAQSETPAGMRNRWLRFDSNAGSFFEQASPAHPIDFLKDGPSGWKISMEATLRHVYYELTTHFYNIQRLKRAQRLKTVTPTPAEGYHKLPTWDVSEP